MLGDGNIYGCFSSIELPNNSKTNFKGTIIMFEITCKDLLNAMSALSVNIEGLSSDELYERLDSLDSFKSIAFELCWMNRSEVQQIKITSRRIERMINDELQYAIEREDAISDWMAEPFRK